MNLTALWNWFYSISCFSALFHLHLCIHTYLHIYTRTFLLVVDLQNMYILILKIIIRKQTSIYIAYPSWLSFHIYIHSTPSRWCNTSCLAVFLTMRILGHSHFSFGPKKNCSKYICLYSLLRSYYCLGADSQEWGFWEAVNV